MVETIVIIVLAVLLILAVIGLFVLRAGYEEMKRMFNEAIDKNDSLNRQLSTQKSINNDLRADLETINSTLRDDLDRIKAQQTTPENPNPQHLRPLFDSTGQIFPAPGQEAVVDIVGYESGGPAPTDDYLFYPETYDPYGGLNRSDEPEGGTDAAGESSGPESVQANEETTAGVVRSGELS